MLNPQPKQMKIAFILISVAALFIAAKSRMDIASLRGVVTKQQQTIELLTRCTERFDHDITNFAAFAWQVKDSLENLKTNLIYLDGVVSYESEWNLYTLTNLVKFAERCQHERFSNKVDVFIFPLPPIEQPIEKPVGLGGHIL